MEKEEWRDIEGYEGLYQVSNLGRIKSLERIDNYNRLVKEQILKPIANRGYLRVCLYKDGKQKKISVHRIVAENFLENPHNYPQVNHKDENKSNNCVENLEWCTAKYNSNYGTKNERVAASNTNGKCSKPLLQIDKNTNEVIAEFPSTMEVKRQLGFCRVAVSECCTGKLKSAYGFKWKFKNEC